MQLTQLYCKTIITQRHQFMHSPLVACTTAPCTNSLTYLLIDNLVSHVTCGAYSPVAMTTQLSRLSIRTELMIFHCSLYTVITITRHVCRTSHRLPQEQVLQSKCESYFSQQSHKVYKCLSQAHLHNTQRK